MEKKNNEQLVLVGAKVKESLKETINRIADSDDRSISYTVARLLETHPEVISQKQRLNIKNTVAAV